MPLRSLSNLAYALSSLKWDLDSLLSQGDRINERLQSVLDQHTGPWGVKVRMVEVKQVDLPDQMTRAIARQGKLSANGGQSHPCRGEILWRGLPVIAGQIAILCHLHQSPAGFFPGSISSKGLRRAWVRQARFTRAS